MMKNIILLLFLLMGLSCSSSRESVSEIKMNQPRSTQNLKLWSENDKLTWKDYQGKVNKSPEYSDYEAMTYSVIATDILDVREKMITYEIVCQFNRKSSWSRDKESLSLLKHEQLHFDIAELMARKIRKFYSEYRWEDKKTCDEILTKVFYRVTRDERNDLQYQYDEETGHGTAPLKQLEWEKKIAQELKYLEQYADTKVFVRKK